MTKDPRLETCDTAIGQRKMNAKTARRKIHVALNLNIVLLTELLKIQS